jgi:[ribosomal protein S18]-alanine N-acetyltransferase
VRVGGLRRVGVQIDSSLMRTAAIKLFPPTIGVRRSTPADIDALAALEGRVFPDNAMSRRSLRRFLASPSAAVIIAEHDGWIAGSGVLLFRTGSTIARLYSLAVDPASCGCGVGRAVLNAAEKIALRRGCNTVRLEVHAKNARAIACYGKAGYREFDRIPRYYGDRGTALRFEKRIGRAGDSREQRGVILSQNCAAGSAGSLSPVARAV